MSIFKETLKKVPWWAWVLFPVGLLLLAVWFLRDRGRGVWPWQTPSMPVDPAAPPSITPKEAEEKREEIKEELKVEEEKIESEADELRKKIEDKFGPRPEG
jgi:hypothetical protein